MKTPGRGTALGGAKVEGLYFLDERLQAFCKDRLLKCAAFKHRPGPAEPEDEKTLDARVHQIVAAAAVTQS